MNLYFRPRHTVTFSSPIERRGGGSMTESYRRFIALDALRGLAALVVVLHHNLISRPEYWASYTGPSRSGNISAPLHLLWDGHEAVIVFFVLSGFVLSLPFWHGSEVKYLPFVLKRVFRLYPAYFVAVALGILALEITGSGIIHGAGIWSAAYWATAPTLLQIADYAMMLGSPNLNTIDPVVWTLIVEMQASFVFVPMLLAMRAFGYGALAVAIALAVATKYLPTLPGLTGTTLYYLWLFVLGAELARRREALEGWLRPLPNSVHAAITVLALILLNAHWMLPVPPSIIPGLTGVGAGILVAECAFTNWARHMTSKAFRWLGDMSYGIYLTHFVIIFGILHLFGAIALWQQIIISLAASIAIATVLFRYVEIPCIALGKALSATIFSADRFKRGQEIKFSD